MLYKLLDNLQLMVNTLSIFPPYHFVHRPATQIILFFLFKMPVPFTRRSFWVHGRSGGCVVHVTFYWTRYDDVLREYNDRVGSASMLMNGCHDVMDLSARVVSFPAYFLYIGG